MASEPVSVSGPVDIESTAKHPVAATDDLGLQRYCHGTRADLKTGDVIEPGYASNYGKRKKATYVYLTGTLRVAGGVTDWQGHSPEALKAMKDNIERLRLLGVDAIDD